MTLVLLTLAHPVREERGVLLAFAAITQNSGLGLIEMALVIVGIGLGLNTASVNGVAVAAVPPARAGTASGILNTARMVGATLGLAILGSLFAAYAGQQAKTIESFLLWPVWRNCLARLLRSCLFARIRLTQRSSFSPRDRRERTAASCPSVCEKTV